MWGNTACPHLLFQRTSCHALILPPAEVRAFPAPLQDKCLTGSSEYPATIPTDAFTYARPDCHCPRAKGYLLIHSLLFMSICLSSAHSQLGGEPGETLLITCWKKGTWLIFHLKQHYPGEAVAVRNMDSTESVKSHTVSTCAMHSSGG